MSVPRRQGWLLGLGLVAATLCGFALRRWPWGRLGLDQFDEGIYCLAAAQLARTGAVDPGLIPYAPPGYPMLVALGGWLTGDQPPGNLVSALAGSATIPLAGFIARSLFGNVAALVTAWSVCLAGPHIAFSRMALTDATFLFAWMLGLAAGVAFVRRPGWSTGLMMGLTVGLAQQVKYNGWLLAAATLSSSLLGLASRDERRPARWVRVFGFGIAGAGGAALVVLPWYLFVEGHGGYDALLRHQRSYLDPPGHWWANFRSQATQAVALATPWPLVATGGFGLYACLYCIERGETRATLSSGVRLAILSATTVVLLGCPYSVGLLLCPSMLRSTDPARRYVALTWLLLGILTPFYHPYARLWLPFEGMHWLLLGGWMAGLVGWRPSDEVKRWGADRSFAWASLVAVLGFAFCLKLPIVGHPPTHGPRLFLRSNWLETLARSVVDRLPRPHPRLLTLVRPALTYSLLSRAPVAVQGDLGQIRSAGDPDAWVLIDSTILGPDPIAPGIPAVTDQLPNWEVVEEFVVPLTLPTALDLDPRREPGVRPADAHFWLLRPRNRTAL